MQKKILEYIIKVGSKTLPKKDYILHDKYYIYKLTHYEGDETLSVYIHRIRLNPRGF